MGQQETNQKALRGKLDLRALLRVDTGLHIGASSDFAPIGAVDSPFLRDPLTKQPIIPGSSLKGKLRTLLARSFAEGYFLNKIEDDREEICRLFGSAAKGSAGGRPARLQFYDIRMTEESFVRFDEMELDTYIGEIKWENAIDRLTAGANPRQIERVPAGTEFAFRLVYNIENEEELPEDMKILAAGLELLQMDYLGGHGSRGYGRVSLHDFEASCFSLSAEPVLDDEMLRRIEGMLAKGGRSA
ncbi:type III-A CRISPR-associated RAMP protein Csm3 [uncultured Selenomonas sp.]|uniref:type III-A CRISPR-associated RAMP protein Csm3 n=1 Tax=uncultured Selenomonas sp. TaxID=159275 RepID=UPI0026377870|nr:type III-A CRISPR-associated RAMP protein Csm3 [uncultured Selenomonas sp.]